MAPFLVKHPILLNNWFQVRETALSTMLNLKKVKEEEISKILSLITRAQKHICSWSTEDKRQAKRIRILKDEWELRSKYGKLQDISYLGGFQ